MWDFRFPGFPLNSIFYYMNGTRNKSIQIDIIFKYIFHPALPGKCLCKSVKNHQYVAPACWCNIPATFRTFIKTYPWKPKVKTCKSDPCLSGRIGYGANLCKTKSLKKIPQKKHSSIIRINMPASCACNVK